MAFYKHCSRLIRACCITLQCTVKPDIVYRQDRPRYMSYSVGPTGSRRSFLACHQNDSNQRNITPIIYLGVRYFGVNYCCCLSDKWTTFGVGLAYVMIHNITGEKAKTHCWVGWLLKQRQILLYNIKINKCIYRRLLKYIGCIDVFLCYQMNKWTFGLGLGVLVMIQQQYNRAKV